MFASLLILHILGATVWTGGHLVLAIGFLPRALRDKNPAIIEQFESHFEHVGIPALGVQIVTGLWLAHLHLPSVRAWFAFDSITSTQICIKLGLLALTLILAVPARIRIVPRLSEENLPALAFHIIAVTALGVLFVAAGVAFRVGGFW